MPFDQTGTYVRPHSWAADQAQKILANGQRFDEESDDVAEALTLLREMIENVIAGNNFDPDDYYTRLIVNALLLDKQDRFNYNPVNPNIVGQVGGWAPLDNGLKIPAGYLPASNAVGLTSFMGRTDLAATLTPNDIASVLGYIPDQQNSQRTIVQVTGLQGALDNKAEIGNLNTVASRTTATEAAIAALQTSVAGKQATLTNPVTFITSVDHANDTFPLGQIIYVDTTGITSPNRRAILPVFRGISAADSYNLAGSGPQLIGNWLCLGAIDANDTAMYQRVS